MKIRTLLPLALSVAALGGVTIASAGGPDNMPAPPSAHHLYVGGGVTMNDHLADMINAGFIAGIAGGFPNNATSLGWHAFVGYQLKSWLDAELSFTDPHATTTLEALGVGAPGADSDSLLSQYYYLDLDAIARTSIYDGIYGFVKGGVGVSWIHNIAFLTLNNFPPLPGHSGRAAGTHANSTFGTMNVGAGLGYEFMNAYGIRASYTHYITAARTTGYDIVPNIWALDASYRFSV